MDLDDVLSTVHLLALMQVKEEYELDEAVQEKEEMVEDGVAKFAKEIEAEEKQVEVEKMISNLKKAMKP